MMKKQKTWLQTDHSMTRKEKCILNNLDHKLIGGLTVKELSDNLLQSRLRFAYSPSPKIFGSSAQNTFP